MIAGVIVLTLLAIFLQSVVIGLVCTALVVLLVPSFVREAKALLRDSREREVFLIATAIIDAYVDDRLTQSQMVAALFHVREKARLGLADYSSILHKGSTFYWERGTPTIEQVDYWRSLDMEPQRAKGACYVNTQRQVDPYTHRGFCRSRV